jgi:D-alanine-D-alanine ligase
MLSSVDNLPYCLEANTLPGMTPTSLLPQEARADGIEYGDLCEKIIEISLKKYNK